MRTPVGRRPRAKAARAGRSLDATAELDALATAVAKLTMALTALSQKLHREEVISAGARGVLKSLSTGPSSVPQLARQRPVTRQFMQRVVDSLTDRGWVVSRPNPAHRRSPLLELSDAGWKALRSMGVREARFAKTFARGVRIEEVARARATLEALHARLLEMELLADDEAP